LGVFVFVKDVHKGIHVRSFWFERRGKKNGVYVYYKLIDGSKHRCERSKLKHLDNLPDSRIELLLDEQITDRPRLLFPDFFEKKRAAFITFLRKTAKDSTIDGYMSYLGRHIFPYFGHFGERYEILSNVVDEEFFRQPSSTHQRTSL
jgi:hypothetical protein